ncbi:hypothetical protein AOQ84DRAFT_363018 [Glonium stellatum]|uniref:Uncharacterized protein n=1 Tax=Glonium stellatum TaxID=574774 RepID=A0A8E2F3F9_9PEZI|nr:hypothetical protein AOQ84DRAFT_363018 [Glonium stellatum]
MTIYDINCTTCSGYIKSVFARPKKGMFTHLFKHYCEDCTWSEKLASDVKLFQQQYENVKHLGWGIAECHIALQAYDRARISYANHQLDLEKRSGETRAAQVKEIACYGQKRKRSLSSSPIPQTSSKKRAQLNKTDCRIVPRARFDEAQEHRDEVDYRVSDDYQRGSEWYVPGKYAALPGNELLNTSGSSLNPEEFYIYELPT